MSSEGGTRSSGDFSFFISAPLQKINPQLSCFSSCRSRFLTSRNRIKTTSSSSASDPSASSQPASSFLILEDVTSPAPPVVEARPPATTPPDFALVRGTTFVPATREEEEEEEEADFGVQGVSARCVEGKLANLQILHKFHISSRPKRL